MRNNPPEDHVENYHVHDAHDDLCSASGVARGIGQVFLFAAVQVARIQGVVRSSRCSLPPP